MAKMFGLVDWSPRLQLVEDRRRLSGAQDVYACKRCTTGGG